jgi:hypothetical protein
MPGACYIIARVTQNPFPHLLGGSNLAVELNARRAIEEGSRLAAGF